MKTKLVILLILASSVALSQDVQPFKTSIEPLGVTSIGTTSFGVSLIAIGAVMRNPKQNTGEPFGEYVNRYEIANKRSKRLIVSGVLVSALGGALGIKAHLTKNRRLTATVHPDALSLNYTFALRRTK